MTTGSAQGYNENIVNYEKLIISCNSFGSAYNPSKPTIKVSAMQAQLASARNLFTAHNTAEATYKYAVTSRKTAYSTFNNYITRINNAFKACDVTAEQKATAQSWVRKLKGLRATPKKTEEEKLAAAEAGKEIVEISSTHMGFEYRADNLDKFIKFLSNIPQYTPNEADMKLPAINAYLTDIKAKNSAVTTSEIALETAKISRNDIMNKDKTGLVDVSLDAKTYIKSVFGANSPQYKQVSGLRFVKIK